MLGNSLCSAKFKQATIHLQSGLIHMCHHPDTHLINYNKVQNNPYLLFNTPELKKARLQMLSEERPKECSYCWNVEESGGISDRLVKSKLLGYEDIIQTDKTDLILRDLLPTYLEVSFSNVCNMKCAYCKEEDSSQWAQENKIYGTMIGRQESKHNLIPYREYNPYVEAFNIIWPELRDRLTTFRITGGEPLLDKHTWIYLKDLIENPNQNLTLAINSNLMIDDDRVEKFINILNKLEGKVKSIELYTSIDTINKEQGEYIRFGMNYDVFFKNLEKIAESVKHPITITNMCTVSNLSVLGLEGIGKYFLNFGSIHKFAISTPYLRNPPVMAVNMGSEVTIPILESIVNMFPNSNPYAKRGVENVLKFARHPTKTSKKMFRMYWDQYDSRRGTNFLNTFPEYEELYYA